MYLYKSYTQSHYRGHGAVCKNALKGCHYRQLDDPITSF